MIAEVIESNSICDYCIRKDNFYNEDISCPAWYQNQICENAEDFLGKELIEIEI